MDALDSTDCEPQDQLESLFDIVWRCERQWEIDDRFDLILGNTPVRKQS